MSPRFTVLTTVFDPPRRALEACLRSVASQKFRDWQHVIVDDGSTQAWVKPMLRRAAAREPRRTVVYRPSNGGIAAAAADGLAAASGELLALLDHDDELTADALAEMHAAFTDGIDAAYSDHDIRRVDGRLAEPFYKPDFSPERLRQQNYITHLLVARRQLVIDAGGFGTIDGAQDHDVLLRLSERARSIAHVPKVLYHWRQAPASVSTDARNKIYAYDGGLLAVQQHCARQHIDADVIPGRYLGTYRVRRRVRGNPLVSVIVPTRGSRGAVWGRERSYIADALHSIERHSTYRNLEFVVVADMDTPAAAIDSLRPLRGLTVVHYDGPFNFSDKVNRGVAASQGEYVLLLNDDTELIEPDSIRVMVALAQDTDARYGDVGMVGAKLLFSDGTLQHGGHVYHGEMMHALIHWPGEHPGPGRVLAVERECSGVTAAAALLPRRVYDEVGGLPVDLPVHFNDVELSMKVRAAGYRIVWTPYACWYHFESRSRTDTATMDEWNRIDSHWHDRLHHDPYYNVNLAPKRADWLELPGRSGAPPYDDRR